MPEENVKKVAATKLAIESLMEENNCSVGAFECWSAFPAVLGVCPCTVLGEMADSGYPLACETDVNGAITLAILRACNLYEDSEFLADRPSVILRMTMQNCCGIADRSRIH